MRSVLLRQTYERQVLVVYTIAVFMTIIDGSMVNVAIPKMAIDFGVRANEVEWIAVGYLLAVAAIIPAAGWLGDRFGTKRVFLWALALFSGISLLCGLSQSLEQLVVFRLLQGLGGGLLVPIGSAMLFRAFPLSRRAIAATAVMSVSVTAPAIGPLLGGFLVDQASWRWIFLINVPIGAVGLVLAHAALREEVTDSEGRLDLVGLVLSGGSVGLLLYTLSVGPEDGWLSAKVLVMAAIGVLGVAAAVVTELRVPQPALTLRLFRDRLFRAVNLASALLYAGFFGMLFVLPIYLQTLRGYSAFRSGLVQSPQAIGILLVSNLAGHQVYRAVGPRLLMVVGGLATAGVSCSFALLTLDTPLLAVAGLAFARGLAIGMVFISIQTAVYATTSHADTGRATSLFNTQRQISYAAGVALAATVLTGSLRHAGPDAADRLPAFQHSFLAIGLVIVPGALLSLLVRDEDVAETRQPHDQVGATSTR